MKGKATHGNLKRILLTAFIALGIGVSGLKAQCDYLGVTAGMQYTNFNTNFNKFTGKANVNFGITDEFRILHNLSAQVDLVYTKYSASRNYDDTANLYDRNLSYNYNTTEKYAYMGGQILVKYNIPIAGSPILPYDRPDQKLNTMFTVFLGGYMYNLASWSNNSYSGQITKKTYLNIDPTRPTDSLYTGAQLSDGQKAKWINPNNYGIVVGIGANFRLNLKTTFSVDIRYLKGFNNIDYGDTTWATYGHQGYKQTKPIATGGSFYKPVYTQSTVTTSAFTFNVALKYRIFGTEPTKRQ